MNKTFLLANLLMFNVVFGISLTTSLLSIYLNKIGISLVGIGTIFAIGAIAAGFLRIAIGPFTDHIGRKGIIQIGIIGYVIFAISLTIANKVFHFIALNLLLEISSAIFWTAFSAYFFDIISKGKEGVQIGTRNILLYSSGTLAPLVAGFTAKNIGFSSLFYISAAVIFVGLCSGFFVKETIKAKKFHLHDFEKEYADILKIKGFKTIFTILFLSNFIWTFWYIYMPIYLNNFGLSLDKIGLILTTMMGIGAVIQHPLGKSIDTKSVKWILIPGFFAIWLFGLAFFAFKSFHSFLINRIAIGLGFDASYWPAVGIFARVTPKREHGGGWAVLMAGASFAYGIAALLGGWLTQRFSIELVLQAVGFLGLATAILIIPNKFLTGKGISVYKKHHIVHITNHKHK